MKKKILSCMLTALLCVGVIPTFAACNKRKDVEIMLMTNAAERAFLDEHFKSVAAEEGFTIGFDGVVSDDYFTKLKTEINKKSPPDILYVRQSNLREFVKAGLIADITTELEEYSTKLADVNATARNMYKYDKATKTFGTGATYAVPKDLSVKQLGYNYDLLYRNRTVVNAAFEASSIDYPKNASNQFKMPYEMDWETENYTWEQYKIMCEALSANGTDKDGNKIVGCDLPNFEMLMWGYGGSLVDPNDSSKLKLNDGAMKKAIDYNADLIASGAANKGSATFEKFIGDQNVCFYGECNSWDIGRFDDTLKPRDDTNHKGWDVMPWPYNPETQTPTTWQGVITSAGYAVSSKCKDKARAVKVIMTLLADDVQQKLVTELKLQLPLMTSMANAYLNSTYDSVYSPKSRKVYINVINGTNGRASDLYTCYEDTWYTALQKNYLDSVYDADKNAAKGKADALNYETIQSTIQQQFTLGIKD